MPKIIGQDSGAVKEITCRHCAARLQYTPSEENRDYSTDYLGDKDYFSYVYCPGCGGRVKTKNY